MRDITGFGMTNLSSHHVEELDLRCFDPSFWLGIFSVFSVKLVQVVESTGCVKIPCLEWGAEGIAVHDVHP